MVDKEIQLLADLNYYEVCREVTRRSATGGIIWEEDGLLLCAGSHPSPLIANGAVRTEDRLDPPDVLAHMPVLGARGHGYGLVVREHADPGLGEAAEEAGLSLALTLPVMARDRRLEHCRTSAGAVVRPVVNVEGARNYVEVTEAAYTQAFGQAIPDLGAVIRSAFDRAQSLLAPHIVAFVAYLESEPVSAAMAYISHGVAGVNWVGTKADYRGLGLGAAVTTAAANAGFDRGVRIAALQSSSFGERLYRRLGFVEVSKYYIFTSGAPAR